MPYTPPRLPSFPVQPLPPPTPAGIARVPRPWLDRESGECAFPVDGEGWTLRACCNPCGKRAYCAAHHALSHRPG
ncbi:MAG: hypothetical protein ACR2FH_06250 [Caulobacteraceae bacterium]